MSGRMISSAIKALVFAAFSGISFAQAPGILWSYTYPGTYTSAFCRTVFLPDGNGCIAFGNINYGGYWSDMLIVRLDADGNEIWSTQQTGSFKGGDVTAEGGYIVAGTSDYVHGSEGRFTLLDQNGAFIWGRNLGDVGDAADQTPDGGFILCGEIQANNDGTLWGTDADGNILWTRTWTDAVFYDILVLDDGSIVIAGKLDSGQALLMKTDSTGDVLWAYPFSGCTRAYSLIQTADGGFAFIGRTGSFLMIKTDAQGGEQWRATLGNAEGHWASTVEQAWDGGYIVSGVADNDSLVHCPLLVRTDPSGDMLWQEYIPYGESSYQPGAAAEAQDGGYFVTGPDEFRIVRLAPGLGVEDEEGGAVGSLTLDSPFPNPFTSEVCLSYAAREAGTIRVQIFDISGNLVTTLNEGWHQAGSHSLSWDGTGCAGEPCSAGAYLVRITSAGASVCGKVILLN